MRMNFSDEERMTMESKHDIIWDKAVNAVSEVIDGESTASGMSEEEAGEIYLEVADELRMRGNLMVGG